MLDLMHHPTHLAMLLLLLLPLVGAVVVWILGPGRADAVRWVSVSVSIVCLVLSLFLAARFMAELPSHAQEVGGQLTFKPRFVPGSEGAGPKGTTWTLLQVGPGTIRFFVGIDGLNLWMIVLTGILFLPSVLVSWRQITDRPHEFYAWLLALQTTMFGIFMSFDIILFYVFFELSLVPLFFLIGIWGGPERRHAAGKFFIYTFLGSMITLLGVLGVVLVCWSETRELTFSIPRLVELVHQQLHERPDRLAYWQGVQFLVFMALLAGFAVKVPLWPLHTWLPLAHVEAPTAGSVDLAGVLLKVGAYGFLRLCVPLAPDTSLTVGLPLVSIMATIGIIYGAMCAYAQDDIKKMVAYSSVSHLGLCMLGMFALNPAGITGSIMQMINHGLSTAGLFLLVGMLYERYHTRKMSDYSGMSTRLPLLGAFMVFICLTSVGLPGLNGFVGEALCLFGVFDQQVVYGQWPIYAVVAAIGMVLGAWYLFTMLQRVFFGPVKEPVAPGHGEHSPITDLNLREAFIIVPIGILCVILGVYPQPILEATRTDVDTIARIATLARERATTAAMAREGQPAVAENDRNH